MAGKRLILLLTIAFGTYSQDTVERTITTSTEWIDGKCCMKNCLGAEDDVECQEWKDSIVKVNKQQGEITEQRATKIEGLYSEVVVLRANATAILLAKLEEARKAFNETWQMKKATMLKDLDAELERFRDECLAAIEEKKNQATTTAEICDICGTSGSDSEATTATDSPATHLHETASPATLDDTTP